MVAAIPCEEGLCFNEGMVVSDQSGSKQAEPLTHLVTRLPPPGTRRLGDLQSAGLEGDGKGRECSELGEHSQQ